MVTQTVDESKCSSNQAAHLGVRRTLKRPSSHHMLRPRTHAATAKAVKVCCLIMFRGAFAKGARFRDDLAWCLSSLLFQADVFGEGFDSFHGLPRLVTWG
ncbi:hypothetical protein, partial [Streptomyces sp. NPDC003996]